MKSLLAALVAVFLLAGCVSVGPSVSTAPTAASSAAPSLGVTTPAPPTAPPTLASTPTPVPTLASTPTPAPTAPPLVTEPPTLEPTIEPTVRPSTGATSEPTAEPGGPTRDLLFTDEMTDPSSGWSPLNEDFVSVTYDTGVLAFRFNQNPSWAYSARQLDGPVTDLLSVADFSPQSDGIFGLLCGDSSAATYYGATVATNGGLVFLETDNGNIKVLERHDSLGLDVSVGGSNPMAMECRTSASGALSLVVGLAKTGPVAVYTQDSGAPANFDVMGLYGETRADGYTLAVDSAAAFGVGGADGTMSDGAQALLSHIPTDLQTGCGESPLFSDPASYVVTCVLQSSGSGAEILQYEQFDTKELMDSTYQDLVTAFGVESTGTCQNGPNETDWSISGTSFGRVQCAPQTVGIRFDWTDDRLNILSRLIDLDGDYQSTYDQWINGGPNQ